MSRATRVVATLALAVGLTGSAVDAPSAHAQDWGVDDAGREQKILERLVVILQSDPFNDYAFQQLRKRAAAGGGLDVIIARFADRVAADPSDVEALTLLARLHQADGAAEVALGYAGQAIDVEEAGGRVDHRLLVLRGIIHSELGQSAEAEADFERALAATSKTSEEIEILRELGDMARREDRIDDAVDAYTQIVERDPNDRFLRWELGSIFFELQRWPEALEQYQAAADLAGRNVEERSRAELEIAGIYEMQGRFADAIAVYESILKRVKSTNWLHVEARTRLVDAYGLANDIEGLLGRLDEMLRRNPRDGFALALRAQILDDLGRTEEALAAYELLMDKAPEADPDATRRWLRLIRQSRGRDDVVAAWEAVVEKTRDPDDRLGHALDLTRYLSDTAGDAPLEAYAYLKEVEAAYTPKKKAKVDEDALVRLERIAAAYRTLGGYVDAERRAAEVYEAILAVEPGRLPVFVALLEMAANRGEYEAESKLLEQIVGSETFAPDVLETIIEVYVRLGNPTRVGQVIALARDQYPDEIAYQFLEAQHMPPNTQPTVALGMWRAILLESDEDRHLRAASSAWLQSVDDLGIIPSTISATEREWARSPDDWRRARLLFYLYAYAGRLDEALELLTAIQGALPQGALALEEHAFVLLQANRPEDALQLMNTLASRRPQLAWKYRLEAANLLMGRGRTDVAPKMIERALENASDNPDALAAAGALYQRLGALDDAEAALAEAVRLAPRAAAHRAVYADILLGLAQQTGDGQPAERAYDVALAGLSVVLDPVVVDDLISLLRAAAPLAGKSSGMVVEDLRAKADLALNAEIATQIRDAAQTVPVDGGWDF